MRNALLILTAMILLIPVTGNCFNAPTREVMLTDAMDFSPPGLRAYLNDHYHTVLEGMRFEDRWPDMAIDPAMVPALFDYLHSQLESGRLEESETARAFGTLACFLALSYHMESAEETEELLPETVEYDGYDTISDPYIVIEEMKDSVIPDRKALKQYKEIDRRYNLAVNRITDFWISAWEKAGNDVAQVMEPGIQIRHETVRTTVKKRTVDEFGRPLYDDQGRRLAYDVPSPEEAKLQAAGGKPSSGGSPGITGESAIANANMKAEQLGAYVNFLMNSN